MGTTPSLVRPLTQAESHLIEFELVLVVLPQGWVLIDLAQKTVSDREQIDVGAHEAAEGIFRCAHDRLAAHVETGVDQHRASGSGLECG